MLNIPTVTIRWMAIASVGLSLVLHAEDASHPARPASPEHDVVENYHGRQVHDLYYRWLEQTGTPAVEQWIDAQNAYTDAVMSGFHYHDAIIKRLGQLGLTSTQRSNRQIVANVLFYMRQTPPQPRPVLVGEAWPNGEYGTYELGTVTNAAEFAWLNAYSPLQHVRPGTAYPAALLITAENDPRVASWQSSKFAAALQKANTSRWPILLITRRGEGHGVSSSFSQRVSNTGAELRFFEEELGLAPAAPPSSPSNKTSP